MMLAPLLATLAPVLSLASPPALAPPTLVEGGLPYDRLAESFLESVGRAGATRAEAQPEAILADEFLLTSVGLFDVWIPRAELSREETAADYRDLCLALLNSQEEWMVWLGDAARDSKSLAKDFAGQRKWIESWKVSVLEEAARAGRASADRQTTTDLFGADEKARDREARLARAFRSATILGQARSDGQPVELVLMPTREGFVEFIAYAGWLLPGSRNSFWQEGIETWSHFYLNDLHVLALEYAAPSAAPGDYTQAYSMKAKTPTGMEQQVVQLGLNKLLAYEHGDALPPSLITGFSINLVTKLYGGCYTRIDGDVRSRVTAKREVFVRGGRPEGGILPPNTADSRWRVDHGRAHYVPTLRQAQKAAATSKKRGGDKYVSFQLVSDDESQRYLTHAPLLGPSAGPEEVVPDAVYGDYLEFTRAYQAAFLHWLQEAGAGSNKKSAKAFSAFLGGLAGGSDAPSIASVAEAVYGLPLSDAEAGKKSLEGRFLRWLAKQ